MNSIRVSFLLMTGMFVAVLTGCVSTPQQQYRNGDFVSHMAAAESTAAENTVDVATLNSGEAPRVVVTQNSGRIAPPSRGESVPSRLRLRALIGDQRPGGGLRDAASCRNASRSCFKSSWCSGIAARSLLSMRSFA